MLRGKRKRKQDFHHKYVNGNHLFGMLSGGVNKSLCACTMHCTSDELAHYMQASYSHASMHIFITISAVTEIINKNN